MTAKEYLQQLHKLTVTIEQRKQEKADLRESLYNISGIDYSKERIRGSSPAGSNHERVMVKLIELENKIDILIGEQIELKDKIIGQIHELDNPNQINVLYKRYVLFEKIEQIADDLGFSYRNIYRLHDHGLDAFEKIHLGNFEC